jgi:hypothetical protein
MPRFDESLAVADWEMDDLAARYKEAQDPYESYDPVRVGGWSWHVVRPVASSSRTFRRSDEEVADEFSLLVNEWREATAIESGLERIILNSAYQRIIGLGPQALPHILRDIEETRDHWFWALTSIVGEDKAAGQTSVGAAVEAWLAWGREAGLIND